MRPRPDPGSHCPPAPAFLRRTRVDELMVTAAIHDHATRLKSFELVAQIRDRL